MASFISLEDWEEDVVMENYIREYDKTVMPVPDIEFEPYILLNKVRRHYMEHIIKLLIMNYECNMKLPGKRLYRLPSAIWRCAKDIEISAAQTSMVLQIYRRNILSMVEELKHDTMAGKINKKLYDCLYKPAENEKRTQTTLSNSNDCICQCSCNLRKKFRKSSESLSIDSNSEDRKLELKTNKIEKGCVTTEHDEQTQIELGTNISNTNITANSFDGISETHTSDELVRQLEKLFEGDGNDDDIFEGVLCDDVLEENSVNNKTGKYIAGEKDYPVVNEHSVQINSLDERLISIAGLINNVDNTAIEKPESPIQRPRKVISSKWLCEEYFLKMKLLELLDQIRDIDRTRYNKIKLMFVDLFGDENEEEDLMSPLNETPEFILSCRERIAPWVVKILTPYYIKGRIKGKALFKALAKHLIRLIYQCSQYPEQYEVHSFVSDFLKTHKVIRSEADFKGFKILNI